MNRSKIKLYARLLINSFRQLFFKRSKEKSIELIVPEAIENQNKIQEVLRRIKYFDNTLSISFSDKISMLKHVDFSLIGIVDGRELPGVLLLKKDEVFNFDFETNYMDGWSYHYMLSKVYYDVVEKGIVKGKDKLRELRKSLSKQYSQSYIFGTGPSLEKAIDTNFNDGIRIVSNTIVKDRELWLHMNPHFIVAGDAIYHFGFSDFAESFRRDLKDCLSLTDTYFVYPAHFHPFCLKEFEEFQDRLIPIPILRNTTIHHDLTVDYSLPVHGNVLLLLLLPLACTFSKTIKLWGFDGRSPQDKLFWSNSQKHFYPDKVEELMKLHPAFYERLVPKDSPDSYVKKVHGDILENVLTEAEESGYKFKMMHFSYTDTLSRRYEDS